MPARDPDETPDDLIRALWPDEPPRRVLTCRHCGQGNRVEVPTAVFFPERVTCGACDAALFLPRDAAFADLRPSAWEHPLDRRAMAALQAIPGFDAVVRWLVGALGERSLRLHLLASNVQITESQGPELLALLDTARARLGVARRPELFLGESPFVNASTYGARDGLMVVQSALLDQLSDEEVVCVLGHELGHLESEHVVYRTLAELLLTGGLAASPVARLLTFPLRQALLHWYRSSELSADRAGLLACRDVAAALRVELKLAGGHRPGTTARTRIRVGPFVQQARQLAALEERWFDSALATMLTLGRQHPLTAWRVMHLVEWVERGSYLELLAAG